MNQIAVAQDQGQIVESVIAKGDLAKLTPQERTRYYTEVCRSVGVNPLTKPFEYIQLNGKLTLYATRACTDQLRAVHNVSVEEISEVERDGVFIVTAKVRNGTGRTDIAKGAVSITGLKGEALANALMKAETKAKRRATLSICGLGWLDETEIDSIPGAAAVPETQTNGEAPQIEAQPSKRTEQVQAFLRGKNFAIAVPTSGGKARHDVWAELFGEAVRGCDKLQTLEKLWADNGDNLIALEKSEPETYRVVDKVADDKRAQLSPALDITP